MAIFGQIGSRVSSLGNQVAGKTKGSLEQAKIDNEIRSKEREIQARYAELGCVFYESERGLNRGSTNFEPVLQQIDRMRQEIREGQKQIEEIRNRVTCPSCGYAIPAGTKFCPNCGASVERYRDQVSGGYAGQSTCPNCGAPVEEGSVFCTSCGTRLPETAPAQEQESTEENTSEKPADKKQKFCPNCGAVLEDGAMFCISCGQKVEREDTVQLDPVVSENRSDPEGQTEGENTLEKPEEIPKTSQQTETFTADENSAEW